MALTLPSYKDQSSMAQCTHTSIHNLGRKKPEFNTVTTSDSGARKKGFYKLFFDENKVVVFIYFIVLTLVTLSTYTQYQISKREMRKV